MYNFGKGKIRIGSRNLLIINNTISSNTIFPREFLAIKIHSVFFFNKFISFFYCRLPKHYGGKVPMSRLLLFDHSLRFSILYANGANWPIHFVRISLELSNMASRVKLPIGIFLSYILLYTRDSRNLKRTSKRCAFVAFREPFATLGGLVPSLLVILQAYNYTVSSVVPTIFPR